METKNVDVAFWPREGEEGLATFLRQQLFAEHVHVPLDRYIRTISEQMRALGYYCVNVMGGGHAIYNGAVRGYDHFVSNVLISTSFSWSPGVRWMRTERWI